MTTMKFSLALVASMAYAVKVDDYCYNEWQWQECSQMSWRYACDNELENNYSDCGYIYWSDYWYEEFFVSCDEFSNDWTWCSGDG